MSKCYLCEEEGVSFRGATFGGKKREICTKCLAQFQIDKEENRVVLYDRQKQFNLSEKAKDILCNRTYDEDDVKEFINQVKECCTFYESVVAFKVMKMIDELAGERFK